jgi:preprotein translocase subunit SecG
LHSSGRLKHGKLKGRSGQPRWLLEQNRGSAVIGALEIIISVTSLLLVVLILLHRGKGGGLSDMFGGGFTSSFAGSSVVERNLDRFTLITAFVWFASIVGLLLLFKG